ncbi:unannotated protein [freshwater metagenome]|uniref:Unannotated protein n=1 Tax=freshwater metagenome TaxID=449393 RepID=A0A6J6MA96_9ZZZZ
MLASGAPVAEGVLELVAEGVALSVVALAPEKPATSTSATEEMKAAAAVVMKPKA